MGTQDAYSCTHMATVSVKEIHDSQNVADRVSWN